MKEISYESITKFQLEFKKLEKKFRTLSDDLEMAKKAAIELFHIKKLNNQSVFPIPSFCLETVLVYKLKKFACRALKGKGNKSGIRIIYAFYPAENRVVFIEIYYKADKENENYERIREYLKNKS